MGSTPFGPVPVAAGLDPEFELRDRYPQLPGTGIGEPGSFLVFTPVEGRLN